MRLRGAILIFMAAAGLGSCSPKGAYPNNIALPAATYTSLARYQRVYVLSPGDQLEVSVDRLPEFSRTVVIRPDGFVSIPKLGEIKLGGLTVPEADDTLNHLLAQRVIEPQATVVVLNPREDVVYVAGEVGRPTAVPLRQAHTVAEALIQAGGATRAGSMAEVALIRLDPSGHLVANMVRRRSHGITGAYLNMQAVLLQSGDIIVVPESNRSQFTRFVQDFINTPLTGANQLFTPYLQFRLIERL